ncbi:hypothetical protein V5799_004265 [Amblyomma americanum]|uniref:Uncharacterized protein n=1 Tax=Amblyomma americanum TaxID=6943 RepID=A0AAQ4D6L2_AMBAM
MSAATRGSVSSVAASASDKAIAKRPEPCRRLSSNGRRRAGRGGGTRSRSPHSDELWVLGAGLAAAPPPPSSVPGAGALPLDGAPHVGEPEVDDNGFNDSAADDNGFDDNAVSERRRRAPPEELSVYEQRRTDRVVSCRL